MPTIITSILNLLDKFSHLNICLWSRISMLLHLLLLFLLLGRFRLSSMGIYRMLSKKKLLGLLEVASIRSGILMGWPLLDSLVIKFKIELCMILDLNSLNWNKVSTFIQPIIHLPQKLMVLVIFNQMEMGTQVHNKTFHQDQIPKEIQLTLALTLITPSQQIVNQTRNKH